MDKGNTLEKLQSAFRLRQIRESAGLTQEQFSEVLGISLSAYKKVESGENQISLSSLRNLHEEMNVSTDFVLFGENQSMDRVWEIIQNCTEIDKMFIMLRLLVYFTKTKRGTFSLSREQSVEDKEILQLLSRLQGFGED